ncbi:Ribophorin I [Boletus edulis BED1]|uniref:Dolichyl-diphosphooligosaccharide--protein glycosyltransferase subunit 1 n=1 Tax=Boletus edulis BED1 TaxID=1328754 RepID=A0AAD4GL84_BOLED|nr:Ribophorin I [Boletus edulis BED1]
MLRRWRTLSLLLLSSLLPSFSLAGPAFENTAIVRTIELGGSLVHVSTTYAVKALEPGQTVYHVTFGKHEKEKTSWIEAKVKGQVKPLEITDLGERDVRDVHVFAVSLPRKLAINGTINLVLETIQTHATYPYPSYAAQADPQLLKYDTDLFVLSPYTTLVQRTKIKSSSSDIPSYSTPEGIDEFVGDASVTKSGATITYGPYHNVASSTNAEFLFKHQQPISAHYNHGHPVLEVMKLQRSVEISHWGSNLNIEDRFNLRNAGPLLRGHFSRLDYQSQNYFGRMAGHILSGLTLHLPAGLTNAYFYDLNGNVSTSHLRQTPSVPRGSKAIQHSILEMRPRYPLLGGWNYSFTLGFDTPLQDSVSWDAVNQRHIVGVPVMTHIPGSVVDEAEVKIILPEGATDIDVVTPFPALSSAILTHVSYLDTTGRPAVSLSYKDLTDKHTAMIYVSYKVPLSAHLKKPVAVGAAFMSLFMIGLVARRVDLRLHKA